jgi:hypothetical protein
MNRSIRREYNLVSRPAILAGNFDNRSGIVCDTFALALERRFDWVATPGTSEFEAKQKT